MSIVVSCIRPDTGEAGDSFRGDSEVGAGADQDFFEAADEFDYAERLAFAVRGGRGVRGSTSMAAQVEDGIADDLAGAVEGDVAAAVAFEEFNAALGKEFGGGDYVGGFGVAAERDDRRVFEEEEDIADFFLFAEGDELLLQREAGRVIDGAELDDRDQILIATGLRGAEPRAFTTEDTEELHRSFAQRARSG